MRKKYGKVFSLYLGNDPFVIVSDFDLYKEAMSKEELLYRPKLGANDDFMFPDEHGKIDANSTFTVVSRRDVIILEAPYFTKYFIFHYRRTPRNNVC